MYNSNLKTTITNSKKTRKKEMDIYSNHKTSCIDFLNKEIISESQWQKEER